MYSPKSLLAVLLPLVDLAGAQFLINELSFGYNGKVTTDEGGNIPNFHIQGLPELPELLSNKVVLSPVAPGNCRGAIWADKNLDQDQWIADIEFRANGPERGGGNLNIWLADQGPTEVSTSSIYSIRRFLGMAIVIDTYGGTGGMLRAFLNDGSIDFSTRHTIDDLAFGQCYYSYRNLGRPSQVKIRQDANNFKVEVDGRPCFETDKVRLPKGYRFGVTAATPDNPDSFEIFKLVVMTERHGSETIPQGNNYQAAAAAAAAAAAKDTDQGKQQRVLSSDGGMFQTSGRVPDDPFEDSIPDKEAESITSSTQQFADLHNRIQSINHHLSTIFRTVSGYKQTAERTGEETAKLLGEVKTELRRLDALFEIQNKIQSLEQEVRTLRNELSNKVQGSERTIKSVLNDHHATIARNIVKAKPSHNRLILVIVGSQVTLVIIYLIYKRRRNSMPKKYL